MESHGSRNDLSGDVTPATQVKDLATPFLRWEAELRGEGRDCMEPARRRVNPATPPRAMEPNVARRPPRFSSNHRGTCPMQVRH